MGTVAERWKIEAVLTLVRQVELDRFYVVGSHTYTSKTFVFLQKAGYTDARVYDEVRSLKVEDYSAGPLRDNKRRPRDLWVFGKYIESFEVYIKFAVYASDGEIEAICVSFHEAGWPSTYPYRKAG